MKSKLSPRIILDGAPTIPSMSVMYRSTTLSFSNLLSAICFSCRILSHGENGDRVAVAQGDCGFTLALVPELRAG